MRGLFLLLFIFLQMQPQAQNFGGFPPATRWSQINTDTARIIFTAPASAQATRIAQLVHRMAGDTTVAFAKPLRKIDIVLHSNTTEANGYVALGPFRSEFYLVPGASIFEFGNLPWHENLAVHEYRHVQQYNAFTNRLTKVAALFGGQNGRALANALAVPDWFFEGDAVYAETAFTGMGRGRLPFFLSAYTSLWQAGKQYSWMTLRNGSYKKYIPNHYSLGYLLVNYGYQQYGPNFWRNVTADASRFKSVFYPFQNAVKAQGHGDFKKFRTEALSFYRSKVARDTAALAKGTITNYYFPQSVGRDSLLYLKESYASIPAFYLRDSRGEHRLAQQFITTENWFHYAAGNLVYAAYNTDKRWSLINYSDLFLLNLRTTKTIQITRKKKYYTPALSPDGSQIVAIEINDSLQTNLHILNAQNGAVIKQIRSRVGDYFLQPAWLDSETIVLSVRTPQGLLSLQMLNVRSGITATIVPAQQAAIGHPFYKDSLLFFTAAFTGNDEAYAYRLQTKKVYQLTQSETGNYNPVMYRDSLVWTRFTANGLQLQQQRLSEMPWKEINVNEIVPETQYPVAQSTTNILKTPYRPVEIKKYTSSTGLLNVHSWDPGLNVYSNNILNTLAANGYYRYNQTEKAHTVGASATYGGFYPQLTARMEQIWNRNIRRQDSLVVAAQREISFGVAVPLNFTKGKTSKGLRFGSSYVYNILNAAGRSKNSFPSVRAQYLSHYVSWAQQLPRARQQLFPKLGYNALVQFRHRIDGAGFQAVATANAFLPGLFSNHSTVINAALQRVDDENRIFSNRFTLARGYSDYYYTRMWNLGVTYHLPLMYPDVGFANLAYLLRVRAAFFFDYTNLSSGASATNNAMRSTGAELYFDTKWWNQLPVSAGVRYCYLIDKHFAAGSQHIIQLILPLDLLPF